MRRIVLLLTVALMMVAMLALSAPNAFAGKAYGWGANDCYTGTYPSGGGPGCGYHWGQR
jgi:hypothetical protein